MSKKILLVNKENNTELTINDEIVWSGYIEDPDTLQDILEALNFDVERIDHSINDESLELPEEEPYFDPYE